MNCDVRVAVHVVGILNYYGYFHSVHGCCKLSGGTAHAYSTQDKVTRLS